MLKLILNKNHNLFNKYYIIKLNNNIYLNYIFKTY